MKLIICYTVFNGIELLEKSIKSIYDKVDDILICYQETSNKGEIDNSVYNRVLSIEKKFDKVVITRYTPSSLVNTKENERMKHTQMMRDARALGATHYILSACDHFYTKEHVQYAKNQIINNDYDVTLTKMFTYYKHPTWQIDPMEDYYMPFISKMYPNTAYVRGKYPVTVDPSVVVNTSEKVFMFDPQDCVMHHYSMVREDIQNKFRNAAASIRWTQSMIDNFIHEFNNAKTGDAISYFGGRKIIEVPNHFNI